MKNTMIGKSKALWEKRDMGNCDKSFKHCNIRLENNTSVEVYLHFPILTFNKRVSF
jgi:hypothetical protein